MAQKSEVLPFTSCITSRSSKSTKITTQNAFNGRGNSTVLRSATGRLSQHGSKVGGPTLHLPVAKAGGLLAFGPAPLVLALVVVGADALVVHHPLDRRVEVERLRLVLAEYVVDALGPPSLCSVVDLEHRFFLHHLGHLVLPLLQLLVSGQLAVASLGFGRRCKGAATTRRLGR